MKPAGPIILYARLYTSVQFVFWQVACLEVKEGVMSGVTWRQPAGDCWAIVKISQNAHTVVTSLCE
jgi:hypothetical protein